MSLEKKRGGAENWPRNLKLLEGTKIVEGGKLGGKVEEPVQYIYDIRIWCENLSIFFALFHLKKLDPTRILVKNKCNLSSDFIVCVLLRSISVATYGKCLFDKKTFENVWSINARINPHGEADTLICGMFGCTFGFNSDMSNDLHICVHITHVSTLIKLCGHEKPTCSQTQVCMSLLSMLEVLACLCKGPCSFVEDVSHLFCNVWS